MAGLSAPETPTSEQRCPGRGRVTEEATMPQGRSHSALLVACVCLLFFASGSVGLAYEVAWKHIFAATFGTTTYAVSVVISVFMGGLALGSFVFGRLADRARRHLLICAGLELGIAASVLLVPVALGRVEPLYRAIFRASENPALLLGVQALVSAAALLVPTFLMGGTLPVLSRFMAARRRQVGPAVGILYGLNTLGAALGAFLAGFVLIKAVGAARTVPLAACANLVLAGLFASLHALAGPTPAAPEPDAGADAAAEDRLEGWRAALLLGAVAASGFASFSYEVLWTRLLTFRLNATVYAFSAMLTAYLLGLGLGGALVGMLRKERRRATYWRLYGYLESAVGICGLCTILLLAVPRPAWMGPAQGALWRVGISVLVMIVPTTLMGAALPVACHLIAGGVRRTGRSVGSIYVFNTIGAVAGALITGFVLVRVLGTRGSLTLASFLMVACGSAVLAFPVRPAAGGGGTWRRAIPLAAVWLLALLAWRIVPADFVPDYLLKNQSYYSVYSGRASLLGYEEGVECVVVVSESAEGYRSIAAGGTQVAGTDPTVRNTQKLQCHVPMLLHPDPKLVCQVGFGSGETAHLFLSYGIERLDCVEISQAMLDMATTYFGDINHGVVRNPRFRPIVMDGAVYLKYAEQKYDVIANDSIWPHLAGNSSLYTLEYFRNAKAHLRPGGIMTSWLPLDIPAADLKVVLATFHEVFPHVYVWSALSHTNMHALLVGCDRPLQVDATRFLERFDRYARRDLQVVGLADPSAFAATYLARIEGSPQDLAGQPLNTEDHPVLQYLESRSQVMRPEERKRMGPRALRFLAGHRDSMLDHLTGVGATGPAASFRADLERMNAANEHVLQAAILRYDDPERRRQELRAANEIAPDHPFFILGARMAAAALLASPGQLTRYGLGELERILGAAVQQGDPGAAQEPLREWAKREPESAGPQLGLGLLLLRTGQPADAVPRLEKALAARPELVDVHLALGTAYLLTNRQADGMRQLETAVGMDPRSAVAHEVLGTAYDVAGDDARAIEHLADAVALDPKRVSARIELASLLLRQRRTSEALAHLRVAVQLMPDSADAHALLGEALGRAGDLQAAARHVRRAAELRRAAAAASAPAAP